jgi:hypothetical protein
MTDLAGGATARCWSESPAVIMDGSKPIGDSYISRGIRMMENIIAIGIKRVAFS